jgi:hypothetical protein
MALRDGRISYVPGTSLFDAEQADAEWRANTEPRPQFPNVPRHQAAPDAADPPNAFQSRQRAPVAVPNVLAALDQAYAALTAEYKNLCAGLADREPMTVAELEATIDALVDRLDAALAPCVTAAFREP